MTSTSTPHYRFGLIGAGLAGKIFHAPALHAVESVQFQWVATRKAESIQAIQNALHTQDIRQTDVETMLADPNIDAVVIATPNDSHFDLSMRALQAGKHIVVDKPFMLNAKQAEAVYREAQAWGAQVFVFHNRRLDGDFLKLKEIVQSDTIGTIHHVEMRFDRYVQAPKTGWRVDPQKPGHGIVFDLAPHLADQALALFGIPQRYEIDVQCQRAPVPDFFRATFYYPQAPYRVHIQAGQGYVDHRLKYEVHGMQGSWRCEGEDAQEQRLKNLYTSTPSPLPSSVAHLMRAHQPMTTEDIEPGDYSDFYRAVCTCLEGLEVSLFSRPAEVLWLQRFLESALQS